MFPNNEHPLERIGRVIVGLGMLSMLFFGPVPGWGLLGLIGIVPLATGAVGTCPIYSLIGFSTAPKAE